MADGVVRQADPDSNERSEGINKLNGTGSHTSKGINGRSERINSLADNRYEGINERSEGINEAMLETIEQEVGKVRIDMRDKIRAVAMVILKEPGLRLPDIGQKTNLTLKSLERHIKLLKGAGLIEYRGSRKTGGFYFKPIN